MPTLQLSDLRLPPTVDAAHAAAALKALLESDSPYGARVSFSYGQAASGWHAPETAPWVMFLIGLLTGALFVVDTLVILRAVRARRNLCGVDHRDRTRWQGPNPYNFAFMEFWRTAAGCADYSPT